MARILSFSDFNELSEGYNFNGSDYGFEDLSSYVELSESEMIDLIEKIVLEDKEKVKSNIKNLTEPKGLTT